jgi:RNA polymerase sigma-70 factor (ECF subfamily)
LKIKEAVSKKILLMQPPGNYRCVEVAEPDDLREIIKGCIRKNEKSQGMLYKRYFGYALKVALIYNSDRERAFEIVDDSFIKVFRHVARYDSKVPFKSWLRKIVINSSIDSFRKEKKNFQEEDQQTFIVPDNSPDIITELTTQDILKLLNLLPRIHRLVFNLYEIEGYSHDEISSLLKIQENSSRVFLARGKKRLRELFRIYFNTSNEKVGNRQGAH